MPFTSEYIDSLRSPSGGWTASALRLLGVPWPPKKGWRKRLLAESTTVPKLEPTWNMFGWFDGSCNPNPGGVCGWGIVLKDSNGTVLHKDGGECGYPPATSNNVGEHAACANLLELVGDLAGYGWRVLIRGDSKLVINQITGRWKAKRGLYIAEYRRNKESLKAVRDAGIVVEFAWVPREQNEEADAMSNV